MRNMLLSALVVFGFMNFCFGQTNAVNEKISVQTYDTKGLVERFQLEGNEAIAFDIPTFIKENDHLERVILNGSIKSDLSTTIIKFDSKKNKNNDGEYVCKEVNSTFKPFLGVRATSRNDFNGVNVDRVVYATSAAIAGITQNEIITEFNGETTNSFCDLSTAVRLSNIGDRVEIKLKKGANEYSKYVVVGSREIKTVTYTYCDEEPVEIATERNLDVQVVEASLTSYPNPTRSMSHVNFISSSNEDVIFSVMDITGKLVHKEIFSNFNGELRIDHNLDNETNGTYILSMQQGKEVYKRQVQLMKQ